MVTITQRTDETLQIILAKLDKTLLRNRMFFSILYTCFSENLKVRTGMYI